MGGEPQKKIGSVCAPRQSFFRCKLFCLFCKESNLLHWAIKTNNPTMGWGWGGDEEEDWWQTQCLRHGHTDGLKVASEMHAAGTLASSQCPRHTSSTAARVLGGGRSAGWQRIALHGGARDNTSAKHTGLVNVTNGGIFPTPRHPWVPRGAR